MAVEVNRFSLPLIINQKNKYLATVLLAASFQIMYGITNRFALFEPMYLPMTWVDLGIPFLPWTFWIYASEYLFYVVAVYLTKNNLAYNKLAYSSLLLWCTSNVIFLIWPTTYPRELYPLVQGETNAITYTVFEFFRVYLDEPSNCAPSLHVSSTFLCSYLFLNEQRKKFPIFFIWACAIAFSTMTTKQHYLADVVTGFALSIVMYWIGHHWFTYREVDSWKSVSTQNNSRILQNSEKEAL